MEQPHKRFYRRFPSNARAIVDVDNGVWQWLRILHNKMNTALVDVWTEHHQKLAVVLLLCWQQLASCPFHCFVSNTSRLCVLWPAIDYVELYSMYMLRACKNLLGCVERETGLTHALVNMMYTDTHCSAKKMTRSLIRCVCVRACVCVCVCARVCVCVLWVYSAMPFSGWWFYGITLVSRQWQRTSDIITC